MPTIQHKLWEDLPGDGSITKKKRDPVFYYIHDLVFDMMLIVEEDGEFGWVKHDTIHNTPHLYNNRTSAQHQASRLGHGAVKIYPWKR